jgi:hypothetical protein
MNSMDISRNESRNPDGGDNLLDHYLRVRQHSEALVASLNAEDMVVQSRAGERLHTENSHKYTLEDFADLAVEAGWSIDSHWVSAAPQFGVFSLRPTRAHERVSGSHRRAKSALATQPH